MALIRRGTPLPDRRMQVRTTVRQFFERHAPPGLTWWHTFGSALLALLIVQALTGTVMALYYTPSPEHAYHSAQYIATGVPFGRLVRGVHRWAASGIVVLAGLHLLRVFAMGAYKYPREPNWMVGVTALVIILGLAFTGYLLPWNQRAYWATTVGARVVGTVPVVGEALRRLLLGGSNVGVLTLTRFFGLHVFFLPGLLTLLVLFHLLLLIRQGIAAPPKREFAEISPGDYWAAYDAAKARGRPFYIHAVRDVFMVAVVLVVVALLALTLGLPSDGPADATDVNYVPRPEWYFFPVFELLWWFKGRWIPIATVVIPVVFLLALFGLPLYDRNPRRAPRRRPLAMTAATLVLVASGYLMYRGATAPQPPPARVAIAGEIVAPATDTTGPGLFENEGCSACHSIAGQGGSAGPDLTRVWGRRDAAWLKRFIRDPEAVQAGALMPAFTDLPEATLDRLVQYLVRLR